MNTQASKQEVDAVLDRMASEGLKAHISEGEERMVIGVVGHTHPELIDVFSAYTGVENVIPISKPFKQASREFKPLDTVVDVGGVRIGPNEDLAIMAGPCAVESEDQLLRTAEF